MEEFWFVNGKATVHSDGPDCHTRPCVLHNPSNHHMRGWAMLLRESTLVERVCQHGIGHPDPDSASYLDRYGPIGSRGTWGVHGCDGCCGAPVPPPSDRKQYFVTLEVADIREESVMAWDEADAWMLGAALARDLGPEWNVVEVESC